MLQETSYGIIPFSKHKGEWKVLVVLHLKGHWGFPKGHAEEGEASLQTAQREFQEETGLQVVSLLSKNCISESYSFVKEGQLVIKEVHYYPALVSGTVQLQPQEIAQGEWLCFSEAKDRLTFRESKYLFQEVLDGLKDYFKKH
jgi:8-oxo-dGTP pyrophosphatase MutT (NUDIX family)